MLTVSRQPAPVDVKAPAPATDPKFDKTTFSTDNTAVRADLQAERADAGQG